MFTRHFFGNSKSGASSLVCRFILLYESIFLIFAWKRLLQHDISCYEPSHDKTNKMACAPSEDSDQPGHLPSLIRVFAIRMKKALALSYPLSAQRRLCTDWADAQADLSLRLAHSHFVGFVMRRLIFVYSLNKEEISETCYSKYASLSSVH